MKTAVVVSGLPASGKTTVARALARGMGFAFLDKDDFLEALYDSNAVETWEDRKALSRRSDADFQRAAEEGGSCVLVSHWHPRGDAGESGTATGWIVDVFDRVIEVHCHCSAQVALERFRARRRHPGHLDVARDYQLLSENFQRWENMYPLGLGRAVRVDTHGPVDAESILQAVLIALEAD